jgi:hypothetical protein
VTSSEVNFDKRGSDLNSLSKWARGLIRTTEGRRIKGENMKRIILALIALTSLIVGCASAPMNVLTPPVDYATSCKELGEGEGTGSGFLFLHVIPIGVNDRLVGAYQQAVNSKGGTHLVNPAVQDYWYYIYRTDKKNQG